MDINPNTIDTLMAMFGGNALKKSQFIDILRSKQPDIDKAKAIEKISLYGPYLYALLTQYAENCLNSRNQGNRVSTFWDFYEHVGGNPDQFVAHLSPEIYSAFENLGQRLSKLPHNARPVEIERTRPTPSAPPAEDEFPRPSAPPAEDERPHEIEAPRGRPMLIASPTVRTAAPANTTQESPPPYDPEPLPPYDIGPPPAYSHGAQPPAYSTPTLPRYDEVVPRTRTWREWVVGKRHVDPPAGFELPPPVTLPHQNEVPRTRTWREWLLGTKRVEPQGETTDTARNPTRGNRR